MGTGIIQCMNFPLEVEQRNPVVLNFKALTATRREVVEWGDRDELLRHTRAETDDQTLNIPSSMLSNNTLPDDS